MHQPSPTRTSQASLSAALAATPAGALQSHQNSSPPFAHRSLAEMAQRDLDAALQLLADRAQYITGSSGAAIALRRQGKSDMLCRASAGENAPELGALLSTEFGLSGESVRTRRLLRCDDAERDARVNREVCHQMGISSVIVMPVVHDDEVLGVFELFSGKVNAFGERDLSALQRLSRMVETAVRLAHAAELPERLKSAESEAVATPGADLAETIVEVETDAANVAVPQTAAVLALEAATNSSDEGLNAAPAAFAAPAPEQIAEQKIAEQKIAEQGIAEQKIAAPTTHEPKTEAAVPPMESVARPGVEPALPAPAISQRVAPAASAIATPPKKPLYWSAADATDIPQTSEPDQSHVPAVLRNLRKCEACGFPVSPSRTLCVECEEKKWRGQLRRVSPLPPAPSSPPSARIAPAPVKSASAAWGMSDATPQTRETRALAAAAPSSAVASAPAPAAPARTSTPVADSGIPSKAKSDVASRAAEKFAGVSSASSAAHTTPSTSNPAPADAAALQVSASSAPEFVLSAGLAPQQSWFGRNKFILISLFVVGATVAAILLLR